MASQPRKTTQPYTPGAAGGRMVPARKPTATPQQKVAAVQVRRTDPVTRPVMSGPYKPSTAPKTAPTNLGGYSKPAGKPTPSTAGLQSTPRRTAPTNQMKANAFKGRGKR